MSYLEIQELHKERHYPIRKLAAIAHVSFQGYYRWRNRTDTPNDRLNRDHVVAITELNPIHQGNLGTKRMTLYINKEYTWGQPINHKRIHRLMKRNGFEANIRRKKYQRKQKMAQYLAENVMNQNFITTASNQKWSSDMTELTFGLHHEHHFKLSAVLDLYGDFVLGFNISDTETTSVALQTFQQAFRATDNPTGVLVHTDCGSAYTSHQFNHFMNAHDVHRSMSHLGTPYDNAMSEKFWNDFKIEWWSKQVILTREDAVEAVAAGINYFNYKRRSETKNGLTPYEYRNEAILKSGYA